MSRPAYLSVQNHALKIEFRDETGGVFRIAVEDLAYLIIDSTEVSLSSYLLAKMSESGTLVLGVNQQHMPVWTSCPWTSFYRHGPVIQLQLETTLPMKKQVWAHIVKKKISMQSWVLEQQNQAGAKDLNTMVERVRSGDPDNVEARAARKYWGELFVGQSFRRQDDDLPNAMLNYGYAIVRAAIARFLCGYGFIPQIGLNHQNLSNAYNLADDLIEPYRPFVDQLVLETLEGHDFKDPFVPDHRRSLVRILEQKVVLRGEVYGMLGAIEETVSSLKIALTSKKPSELVFPDESVL